MTACSAGITSELLTGLCRLCDVAGSQQMDQIALLMFGDQHATKDNISNSVACDDQGDNNDRNKKGMRYHSNDATIRALLTVIATTHASDDSNRKHVVQWQAGFWCLQKAVADLPATVLASCCSKTST